MKRVIFVCLIVIFFTIHLLNAQVGINTLNPQATLDIKKDLSTSVPDGLLLPYVTVAELNARSGLYTANQNGILVFIIDVTGAKETTSEVKSKGIYCYDANKSKWILMNLPIDSESTNIYNANGKLESNREVNLDRKNLVFSNTGNIGIGTTKPTNKLHIAGTSPLRLENVLTGKVATDKVLVLDEKGVVKSIGTVGDIIDFVSTPTPALLVLEDDIRDFLSTKDMGESQYIPMTTIKNEIPDLTINSDGTKVYFPPGTYQITLVYEAYFDVKTGTPDEIQLSSYFVDFPGNNDTDVRIHSTDAHMSQAFSNHGSEITFVTKLDETREWDIKLGRGQSGNTEGPGLILSKEATELIIYRMGD